MRSSLYVTLMSGGVAAAFDPVSLFAKYNASGFYLPFAKSPTRSLGGGLLVPMYQDQGGTPVDADGESIGLAIDESEGAAVGAELVTNGTFDTDTTGWTDGRAASLSSVGGRLRVTNNGMSYGYGTQAFVTVPGGLYRVEIKPFVGTAGTFSYRCGTSETATDYFSATDTTETTYVHYFRAVGTTTYITGYCYSATTTGVYSEYDDISIKPVSGNHALQTTASAKPTFRTGSPNVARGDGVDDNLLSSLNPSTTMTLIEVGTPDSGAASDVLIGSQPASNGKAYLALSSSGYLAGGVGTQATSTIVDSTATDIRSVKCGKAVQWNGSTVRLFLKVAGGSFAKVYEAAQSGAVNTTIPFRILSLNNNGTSAASADTDTLLAMALDAEVNESDIEATMDHFLNL